MRIAVPLVNCRLSPHFGHSSAYALFDVDPVSRAILNRLDIPAPPHEPGRLPLWLGQRGVNLVIAGGMGRRALALFAQQAIDVVTGAQRDPPEALIQAYLAGTLETGENACRH